MRLVARAVVRLRVVFGLCVVLDFDVFLVARVVGVVDLVVAPWVALLDAAAVTNTSTAHSPTVGTCLVRWALRVVRDVLRLVLEVVRGGLRAFVLALVGLGVLRRLLRVCELEWCFRLTVVRSSLVACQLFGAAVVVLFFRGTSSQLPSGVVDRVFLGLRRDGGKQITSGVVDGVVWGLGFTVMQYSVVRSSS